MLFFKIGEEVDFENVCFYMSAVGKKRNVVVRGLIML